MERHNQTSSERITHKHGLFATAGAFAIWGTVVIFWKQLSSYGALELICHRLIWGILIATITLYLRGSLKNFIAAFKVKKQLRIQFTNGLLLTTNWLCYVYAITHEHILEGSLAYFMVPILNTAMGFLFLKEKLRPLQWVAIALATLGVANEMVQFGRLPWMAIVIAITFACYGMNKTRSTLGPLTSLTMEMSLMLPIAIPALAWLYLNGQAVVTPQHAMDWVWMPATGLITIIPLVLFAFGAKRVQLTTIGVFQFLAPTLKFFIGVFLYHEDFPPSKFITFGFIWLALAIYIFHLLPKNHSHPKSAPSSAQS